MIDAKEGEYPPVLVINGEPFWSGSATGLTISRLFMGWPIEKLACLYMAEGIQPEQTVCERYWKLNTADLMSLRRFVGSKQRPTGIFDEKNGREPVHGGGKSADWMLGKAQQLRRKLAGQAVRELDRFNIPEFITREIDSFAPQVIYSNLASNLVMQAVIDIADRLELPVAPHFMDDWPPTLYNRSLFRPILRRELLKKLNKILIRAPIGLVIGDAMCDEYQARYGGKFLPFMNAIEPFALEQPVSPTGKRQTLRLVYIGGLHLNRWRSLQKIGEALKELVHEGLRAEALIYTQPRFQEDAKKLNIPGVMRFAGALQPSQVLNALREADILLHIESFDTASRAYTRLSISTKIPECMSAARPILAYGPQELASIRYIQESRAGVVVTDENTQALISALRGLMQSEKLRETLGMNGYRTAALRHNAVTQRESFRSILERVAIGDIRVFPKTRGQS